MLPEHCETILLMKQEAEGERTVEPLLAAAEPVGTQVADGDHVSGGEFLVVAAEANITEPVQAEAAWYPLDERHVHLERLLSVIFGIFVLAGLLVGFGIWFFVSGPSLILYSTFVGALALDGFLTWFSLYWPRVEHRHTFWRLDETGLEIRRGVFWQHQISVPLSRLQHADIGQGPLQRRFGLGKLTVHTAGTANASVELNGLAIESATWLRDMLIRHKESQDVV